MFKKTIENFFKSQLLRALRQVELLEIIKRRIVSVLGLERTGFNSNNGSSCDSFILSPTRKTTLLRSKI